MQSMFRCIVCERHFPLGTRFRCDCGELLEVEHKFEKVDKGIFDARLGVVPRPFNSGAWRYKELIHPHIDESYIVSRPE